MKSSNSPQISNVSWRRALGYSLSANLKWLGLEWSAYRADIAHGKAVWTFRLAEMLGQTDEVAVSRRRNQVESTKANMLAARAILDSFTGEVVLWRNGLYIEDAGREFVLEITYLPFVSDYKMVLQDEGYRYTLGYYASLQEAVSVADTIAYPVESEACQPAPAISREESNAAGEVRILFHGKLVPIKSIVDQALDQVGQDAGQQYEIFLHRARIALTSLPQHITSDQARTHLQRYLAYERF